MSFVDDQNNYLFTNQIRLKDLRIGNEYRLILELKNVIRLRKANSEYFMVILADDENEIKIFTKNPDYLLLETKKHYEFIVFFSKPGKFYLKGSPKNC
ncbi:DNA polymerase III DnaE [Salmonella enterica subsp. enterica serovar Typhimurium str. DT104]|nr:DNA polymerase III DnaE [Salmonella enterica subsp. enterica serovar Typhimurium str. DT104]